MKKTILSLCLLLCMLFTMVACSSTPYDYNLNDYIQFTSADAYKTLSINQEEIDRYKNQNRYQIIGELTTKDDNGNAKIGTDKYINKGGAQAGDVVTLTYSGVIAGETEANAACTSASAVDVTVGTDFEGLPAGFDDALLGITAGEDKGDIVLTYPTDHATEALRDKEVTFTVKVTKIARPNYVVPTDPITDKTAPIVQWGDKITLDYSGTLEGEFTPFEGGTASDATLWIGSDNFIKGFESQLVGAPIGVQLKLKMTFPEDYSDSTKAGKNVTFTVTVDSIDRPTSELTVELLNEYLADEGVTYATLGDWENELTQEFKEDAVQTKLLEVVKVISYPEEETTGYAEDIVNYYEYIASYSNYSLRNYAVAMGYQNTEDFIKKLVIPQAQKQVKSEMALLLVARQENVTVSDAEFNEYLEENYATNGYDSAKQFRREADEENIRMTILTEKVIKHLADKYLAVK